MMTELVRLYESGKLKVRLCEPTMWRNCVGINQLARSLASDFSVSTLITHSTESCSSNPVVSSLLAPTQTSLGVYTLLPARSVDLQHSIFSLSLAPGAAPVIPTKTNAKSLSFGACTFAKQFSVFPWRSYSFKDRGCLACHAIDSRRKQRRLMTLLMMNIN